MEHIGKATFKVVDPDNTYYRAAKALYWQKWKAIDPSVLEDDFEGDPDYPAMAREL